MVIFYHYLWLDRLYIYRFVKLNCVVALKLSISVHNLRTEYVYICVFVFTAHIFCESPQLKKWKSQHESNIDIRANTI